MYQRMMTAALALTVFTGALALPVLAAETAPETAPERVSVTIPDPVACRPALQIEWPKKFFGTVQVNGQKVLELPAISTGAQPRAFVMALERDYSETAQSLQVVLTKATNEQPLNLVISSARAGTNAGDERGHVEVEVKLVCAGADDLLDTGMEIEQTLWQGGQLRYQVPAEALVPLAETAAPAAAPAAE